MTMTATTSPPTRNGRKRPSEETPALADQIVLSGAGLASQGITAALRVVGGALSAVDTLVLGGLDIAEQVAGSSFAADLSTKGLAVARQAWITTVETYQETLAGF
jgi:hypothetical protein